MNSARRRLLGIAIVVALLSADTYAAAPHSRVALLGDQVPDLPAGATFDFFLSPPWIDGAGNVAFAARIRGTGVNSITNGTGIWMGLPGSLHAVARAGDPAPGMPGMVFNTTSTQSIQLSSSGKLAFHTEAVSSPRLTFIDGLWVGAPGAFQLVAKEGDAAPGLGAGVTLVSFANEAVNADGRVAVAATVKGTGVTSFNNTVIYAGPAGSLQPVAREGGAAPGRPVGTTLTSSVFFGHPGIDGSGRVSFAEGLTNDPAPSAHGFWVGQPDSPQLFAYNGDPAPGFPAGVKYDFDGDSMSMNRAGLVGLLGSVSGSGIDPANAATIWLGQPGALAPAFRAGDQAPAAKVGTSLHLFGAPRITDSGSVAFAATLSGTGVTAFNDEALYFGPPDALKLVAREGDPAPGLSDTFGGNFTEWVVNNSGQVAFVNALSSARWGLFGGSPGDIKLLAITNEPFDVGGGDFRNMFGLTLNDQTSRQNEVGSSTVMNDSGQVLFHGYFSGGTVTDGYFVTTVPEPASLALLTAAALLPLRRRRRNR